MWRRVESVIKKNQSVQDLVEALGSAWDDVKVTTDYRAAPYLDHQVAGWVFGPPNSNVVAVISGAAPDAKGWRRFTLSRKSAKNVEIDVFPTAFKNPTDPLSPGIPPGASRPE